jgi:ABC-type oligopeptide transport system ATPase subunit
MKIESTKNLANERFVALVVGESGIGKTSLAKTLPDHKRVLIISAESGLLCLQGTDIDVITVDKLNPWKKPKDAKENGTYAMTDIYMALMKDEYKKKYDYIFIDSITEISEMLLADLKIDPVILASKNGYEVWNKYSERMTHLIKGFRDLAPYSVIFTCLNTFEKDGVEMREDFKLQMAGIRDSVKAWIDIVLKYEVFTHEDKKFRKLITDTTVSRLAKDRSGKLKPYEEANLSSIINKVLKGE